MKMVTKIGLHQLLPIVLLTLFPSFIQAGGISHKSVPKFTTQDVIAKSYCMDASKETWHAPLTALVDSVDSTTFTLYPATLSNVFAGNAVWYDYDHDGFYDILLAGWDDTSYITKIYHNNVGTFEDIHADIIGLGTERGLSWADYDRDGDKDIAITGRLEENGILVPVSRIYKNNDGQFVDIQANLKQLNGGSIEWGDYDHDGDLDVFLCGSPDLGNSFYSIIYRNDSKYRSLQDSFTDIHASIPGVWGSAVQWGDYDNDDDLDLILTGYGDFGQTVKIYRNDGGNQFTDAQIPFPVMNSGAVGWADFDNDGDLDVCITGCTSTGAMSKIYRNDGMDAFLDIEADIKPMCMSAVAWGDYDNDGDLDLALSGAELYSTAQNPTTTIYQNDSGKFADTHIRIPGTWFGSLHWGDFDNDGNADLIMSGGTMPRVNRDDDTSSLKPVTLIYKNNTVRKNIRPELPPSATSIIEGNKITFSWSQASDMETPVRSLTYNLRIGTTPGGTDILEPRSNPQTGILREPTRGNAGYQKQWALSGLPDGTYYWSVQTIDNEYSGSSFTQERSVVINPTGVIYEQTPTTFDLYQNYPNPFNPSTIISYALPVQDLVTLNVYNTLGQQVATLVNEMQEAGNYHVSFASSTLPTGLYYYRLTTGSFTDTKTMLLVK